MNSSSFMLLLRLGVSLAIVMGLIWAAAKVLRARGGALQLRPGGPVLEVVERRPLGRNTSVALVRVGGQAMLIGIAEQRVELLQAVPHLDLDPDGDAETEDVRVTPLDDPGAELDDAEHDFLLEPVATRPLATTTATRWTGSFGAPSSGPSRTNLLDALRDVTVRRATSSRPPQ